MENNLTLKARKQYESFNNKISTLHLQAEFENKVMALKKCTKTEYPSDSAEVVRLYESIGIVCEMGQTPEYYIDLLRTVPAGTLYESKEDLDNEIWKYLYGIYKDFPQPAKIMERILDNCGSEEFKKEKTMRLRILKEFLKYGHGLTAAGYTGLAHIKKYIDKEKPKDINELLVVDDGVFEVLQAATKEEKKDKYSLLVLAQELAEGKFKNNGASKEPLYLLAIVLGMKYYPYETEEYCKEKDIVKNIFNDYYNDNLIRYITSYKNVNNSAYEDEPLGLGIDYKNYAEAVFIYFMNKECYSAEQKIKKIYKVLKNIKKKATNSEQENVFELLSTNQQKDNFIKIVLQLDEEEIEEYILWHYNCKLKKGSSPFGLAFSHNTIYKCYDTIRDEIAGNLEISKKEFRSALKVINTKIRSKKENLALSNEYKKELDSLWELELNKFDVESMPIFDEDFRILIEKVNERLDPFETLSIYNDEKVAKITRTKLIAAYFHGYCMDNFDAPRMFSDVLLDFEMWLNETLEEAGFCKLDYKNVFDMLVVFFAYCRVNNKLYMD